MTWLGYALINALFSSLTALFEKRALNRVHSVDFSAAIAFTTALLTLPVLFLVSWQGVTLVAVLMTFNVSILAAVAFLNIARGIRHLEISLSAPMFLLGPLLTTLFAYMLLGERISLLQIFGMLLLLFGTYILETAHFMHGGEFFINIWKNKYSRFILYALVLYGLSSVGDRFILGTLRVNPILYLALVQFFIAINFIAITWHHRGSPLQSLTLVKHFWKTILIVALLTICYRLAQSYAVSLAAVGLVVAIKRSSALFTTIIGGELFHDHGLWRKAIACVVMIGGVYLITIT